jgi:Zn-dependent M28 family amino/carboxypeptidase
VALVVVATVVCTAMPGRSFRGAPTPLDAREQRYEAELRADVRALAALGPRDTTRPAALDAAAATLVSALGAAGYEPRRHPYPVDGVTCENIDGEVPGAARRDEIVVIGAHYDSAEGAPGADDNASGAAAVLALARAFHGRDDLARTVRFALFTNEEPPHFWHEDMGSLVYARAAKARGENVVAMLSLESLAYFSDAEGSQHYPPPLGALYPGRGDFIAFVGDLGSRSLVRRVVGSFRRTARVPSEGAALPAVLPGVGWSDQWSFWQVGYPGVMVTDTAPFRNPHYHRGDDTPETLDYDRFARVVAALEAVVSDLASDGGHAPRPRPGHSPSPP